MQCTKMHHEKYDITTMLIYASFVPNTKQQQTAVSDTRLLLISHPAEGRRLSWPKHTVSQQFAGK